MGDKILVPFSIGYGRAVEGLGELTNKIEDFMRRPHNFKLVLFTGGADVSPQMYGENESELCGCNAIRDAIETEIYTVAMMNGIKMAGICRGAQLLNVLTGGRMMHHINNHEGGFHYVTTSIGETIVTNSMHHQMIVPGPDGHVVAWSKYRLSDCYIGKDDKKEKWEPVETEAIVVPSISACGVQWHPECMKKDSDGYKFFYSMVTDLLSTNANAFANKYEANKT